MTRGDVAFTVRSLLVLLRREGWRHTVQPTPLVADPQDEGGWLHIWTQPQPADPELAYDIQAWVSGAGELESLVYEPHDEPGYVDSMTLGAELVDRLGPVGLHRLAVTMRILPGSVVVFPQIRFSRPSFDLYFNGGPRGQAMVLARRDMAEMAERVARTGRS